MKRWVVFSGLVAALMAHPVAAFQQPSSAVDDQTVTELPSIDVKANVQRNVIDDFVRAVTASPGHQGQVAQFNGEVCPGVVNLPAVQAQAINDRIASLALSLDLKIGEPGCQANILVIAADDADPVASELVEMAPGLFDSRNQSWRERERRAAFLAAGRPARWWHVSRTETGVFAGMSWSATPANAGPGAMDHGLSGTGAPVGGGYGGNISSRGAVTNITGAVVVLDTRRIGRVGINALGDYVAMVALARLEPDADVAGLDTVLNLFQGEATRLSVAGLTPWDRAYLDGVYSTKRDALHAGWQEQEIARSMQRTLSRDARAGESDQ